MSDTELLAALRAGGGDGAFTALCERYEKALRRYAAHVLRARPAIVDDVVQESLLRAHRALRRDDRHIEVRPYLYRLVRNCCLDELARVRTDSVPLHLLHPGEEPSSADDAPHRRFEQRQRVDTALADLADLPETQRHALIRRELDGLSHEQVAAELGITPGASKALVYRARETLTRAEAARDNRCEDVRYALLRAHDAKRRAPVSALRHAAICSGCRTFRAQLKAGRRAMGVLVPLPLVGGAVAATLLGASKPVAVKTAAAAAAAAVAAGGAYELQAHVFGAGDPAPIAVSGVAVPGGHVAKGAPLPEHTALVTAQVAETQRAATLSCPAGMRVAGLVPAPAVRRSHGFDAATVVGASERAMILLGPGEGTTEIAILCRVPDANGSVRAAPAGGGGHAAGALVVHACRRRAALRASRHAGAVAGTVTSRQPLTVLAGRAGWLRVRTDAGRRGWIRPGVVC